MSDRLDAPFAAAALAAAALAAAALACGGGGERRVTLPVTAHADPDADLLVTAVTTAVAGGGTPALLSVSSRVARLDAAAPPPDLRVRGISPDQAVRVHLFFLRALDLDGTEAVIVDGASAESRPLGDHLSSACFTEARLGDLPGELREVDLDGDDADDLASRAVASRLRVVRPRLATTCAASCPGCCDGELCRPGNDLAACGVDGASCDGCGSDEKCDQGSCGCVPACVERTCGDDGCGGSCGGCEAGQRCEADGRCVCDAASCAGCCEAATARCAGGSDRSACGSGGELCEVCALTQTCFARAGDPDCL